MWAFDAAIPAVTEAQRSAVAAVTLDNMTLSATAAVAVKATASITFADLVVVGLASIPTPTGFACRLGVGVGL